jgi:hypothetical protein
MSQIDSTAVNVASALFSLASAAVAYIMYRRAARELRLTANERLMRMVIDIDREMISHPELMWLTPSKAPAPDLDDDEVRARLKAFMYMHLNIFDVAFNYYNVTLGITSGTNWFRRRFVLSRDEIDHWEGWKTYMSWFVQEEFVKNEFFPEADKWYGPRFRNYLRQLSRGSSADIPALS